MNSNKLKGKLVEHGINYEEAAKAIGITSSTFSNKINGKKNSKFYVEELDKLADYLNLSRKERGEIFFD